MFRCLKSCFWRMKFKCGTNDKFRRLGEHCSAPANHGGWASPPLGEPIRGFQTRRNAAEERPESRQRDAHGPARGKGKASRGCPGAQPTAANRRGVHLAIPAAFILGPHGKHFGALGRLLRLQLWHRGGSRGTNQSKWAPKGTPQRDAAKGRRKENSRPLSHF